VSFQRKKTGQESLGVKKSHGSAQKSLYLRLRVSHEASSGREAKDIYEVKKWPKQLTSIDSESSS